MHDTFLSFLFANPSVFDPMTMIGLGFAIHAESAVEYLKANWYLPGQAAPYAATVISIFCQVAICLFYHIPLSAAVVGVIAQTAATAWWHELSTPVYEKQS